MLHNCARPECPVAAASRRPSVSTRRSRALRVPLAASAATVVPAEQQQPVAGPTYVTQEARAAVFARAQEQPTEAEARVVSGRLPDWLSGSLLLNGCGDYSGMLHLFDGFACLTRLHLSGGRATASQRFLASDAFASFSATGRPKYREFATPVPADGPLQRAAAVAENVATLLSKGRAFTDNASVSLTPLPGGKLLALSEARTAAYVVDSSSLATLSHVEYGDAVAGDLTTAHPKPAPGGALVNFARSLPFGGYTPFLQDRATLARTPLGFVRDRDPLAPCWVHDMAATTAHLVIVEPPLFINMRSLVVGTPCPYAFMDWRPEAGTRVHVVALDGSGVVTHTAPTLFTFHFANAFERRTGDGSASEIVVDFSVYDDPTILNDLSLDAMRAYPGADISPSRLRRLTIPLHDPSGQPVGPSALAAPAPLVRDEASYGNFVEFPACNPLYRGLPYRYAYSTAAVRPTNIGNALARHDLVEGSSRLWHEPGAMPAEPAFVPRPGAAAEDDGVVLSVLSCADGSSSLLVLDGASMAEVARVALPFVVPYRFHGCWVGEEGR